MSSLAPLLLSDSPCQRAQEAAFHFEAYAKTLAAAILRPGNETPFVICIAGKWGSGKTSLMHLVREQVNAGCPQAGFSAPDLRPCKTIWFNPWRYSTSESLWVALLRAIGSGLREDAGCVDSAKACVKALKEKYDWPEAVVRAATSLLTGGMGTLELEESRIERNLAFYDEFRRILNDLVDGFVSSTEGGVLVVFIDDLDRCMPRQTVQVLEAIKLFLDTRNCVFVLAADSQLISSSVTAHYEMNGVKDFDGDKYLDKLVQLRFELPPLRPHDMVSFIRGLPGLEDYTRDYLELIAAGVATNPRRIKTFLNHLALQWSLLQGAGLQSATTKKGLTEWLVLNESCPILREYVAASQEPVSLIRDLIIRMKQLSSGSLQELEDAKTADKDLAPVLASNATLQVLRKGDFLFEEAELEAFVHFGSSHTFLSDKKDLKAQIDAILDELTPREKRVLQLRYGLKDGHSRTFAEVGQEFNVTGERIRQIEAKALRKLRHPSRSRRLREPTDQAGMQDVRAAELARRILGLH